jgi:hypothetical protein
MDKRVSGRPPRSKLFSLAPSFDAKRIRLCRTQRQIDLWCFIEQSQIERLIVLHDARFATFLLNQRRQRVAFILVRAQHPWDITATRDIQMARAKSNAQMPIGCFRKGMLMLVTVSADMLWLLVMNRYW